MAGLGHDGCLENGCFPYIQAQPLSTDFVEKLWAGLKQHRESRQTEKVLLADRIRPAANAGSNRRRETNILRWACSMATWRAASEFFNKIDPLQALERSAVRLLG